MVMELPETPPVITDEEMHTNVRVVANDTIEPMIGLPVLFCTTKGIWPAVILRYDHALRKVDLQVANKHTDGWSLITGVPHISKGTSPCWARRDEAPPDALPSDPAPRRAHVRSKQGKVGA